MDTVPGTLFLKTLDSNRYLAIPVELLDFVPGTAGSLEYGKTKQLFFMNDFTNDSYKDGADLAQKQLSQAYKNIHETIVSNPYYYDSARKSAQQIIVSLVRGLNKNIPDLTVDVQVGVL